MFCFLTVKEYNASMFKCFAKAERPTIQTFRFPVFRRIHSGQKKMTSSNLCHILPGDILSRRLSGHEVPEQAPPPPPRWQMAMAHWVWTAYTLVGELKIKVLLEIWGWPLHHFGGAERNSISLCVYEDLCSKRWQTSWPYGCEGSMANAFPPPPQLQCLVLHGKQHNIRL